MRLSKCQGLVWIVTKTALTTAPWGPTFASSGPQQHQHMQFFILTTQPLDLPLFTTLYPTTSLTDKLNPNGTRKNTYEPLLEILFVFHILKPDLFRFWANSAGDFSLPKHKRGEFNLKFPFKTLRSHQAKNTTVCSFYNVGNKWIHSSQTTTAYIYTIYTT